MKLQHYLGGLEGLGPIDFEKRVFVQDWEKRIFGMLLALGAQGIYTFDEMRHAIERMSPAHYLGSTYYEHWLAALEDKGVPCGTVNNMLQALGDAQARAREMVVEVEHSELGSVQTLGLPVKFSRTSRVITPLPVPLVAEVSIIQLALLAAVHAQPLAHVRATLPSPPASVKKLLADANW